MYFMNFFRKLFGKTDLSGNIDNADNKNTDIDNDAHSIKLENVSQRKFKDELYISLKRYYSSPELVVELNLTDEHGKEYKEHEAYNGTFKEWSGIQSYWDRMGVLYDLWDETELVKLNKWQVINRYVNDRRPVEALEFFKSNIIQDDYIDIRLPVALSKMQRSLDSLPAALYYAESAYTLRPDLDITAIELASVLNLSTTQHDRDRAHTLMQGVLEKKIKASTEKEVALLNFFLFSEGYIDSSVFAALYLNAGDADLDAWDTMADEYYYCPNFRLEHAAALNKKGETMRMLAKLDSLTNEFPWHKNAVNTYIDAIQQLRESMNDEKFMSTELARLEQYKAMRND